MPNINVTYGEMNEAATRLRTGKDSIIEQLRELMSRVDNLVANGYVTDASSVAFQASYTEFNTGANQTIEGLTGISTYLDKAAEALRQTDEELANALK